MEGTKPKSIFDIPRPVQPPEEKPKPRRRRRSKTPKRKRPKVARAGGVEVSQKTNVRGQKQITLKHKGGLTQEITIHTGDSKPRGAKAKGQTASWNMKPAKFKASRGLRDDRVYLQPPKREYFGNRYRSALQQLKIDQKVKEAGASKNKEIADVRDTANREKRELERRERAKEDTITELKKEKAGIVASYNVSQRNQSKATILGGDVGELNKLINRRGFGAIKQLVIKGEITDDSTILQLDLTGGQIEELLRIRETEQSDYVLGKTYVFTTPKGLVKQGKFVKETAKFVKLEKPDGGMWSVPKAQLISGNELRRVRSESRDPAVRSGSALPRTFSAGASADADFGEPRVRTESEERERPEWVKRSHRRDAKPRTTARSPRTAGGFKPADEGVFTSSSEEDIAAKFAKQAQPPQPELTAEEQEEIRFRIYDSLVRSQTTSSTDIGLGAIPEPEPAVGSGSGSDLGTSGEEDEVVATTILPAEGKPLTQPLELVLEEPEADIEQKAEEAGRRKAFLEDAGNVGGGGSVRLAPSSAVLQEEVYNIEEGTNRYSIPELRRLIDAVSDTDPAKPYLKSSFSTFSNKAELLAEERKQRERALAEAERRSPPATGTTIDKLAGETPREFFEGLRKQRGVSAERLQKFKETRKERHASEPRSPERDVPESPREQTERLLRGATPETTFLTAREVRGVDRPPNLLGVVDNRKERKRGSGRSVQRPVKDYTLANFKVVVRSLYGTGAKANALIAKAERGKRDEGAIYINDKKVLNALGFRD